jgi:MFS family permease
LVWPLDIYFNNLTQPPAQPSGLFMLGLWFWGWLWLWLIFPIFFIPLFFPTGRPPSPRWRWLIALGLGLCAFFVLFVTFGIELGAQDESWTVANPIGFLARDSFPELAWAILLLSFAALSVTSLFVRYRRAQAVERQQIKWLLYAAGVFLVSYALSFVFSDAREAAGDLWNLILFLGVLTLPVAIAVAILRYRLYDIDVIIRKTLVYAALTALLALVYFGSVVLLQRLFGTVTGVAERSPLAIVVSTLAIAALFTPLRRRIQDWIDRRFFRSKVDAQQVLAQFALTARDETDLDALTAELVRVVQETMQPEGVSVWLKKRTSVQERR